MYRKKSDFKLSLKRVPINIYVFDKDEIIEVIAADIQRTLIPTQIGQKFIFNNRCYLIKDIIWVYDPPVFLRLDVTVWDIKKLKAIEVKNG